MAYGRGGLYMDPSFQMGMALGNAYGNMWAANAKKRQGEHAKDILEEMRQQQQIEEIANMNQPQAAEAAKEPQKAVSVTGNIPGYDLRSSVGSDPTMGLSRATTDGRSVQENAVDEVLNLKRMGSYPITAEQQTAGKQLEKLGQYPMNVNVSEQNTGVTANPQLEKLGFNPNFSVDEFKRKANELGLNKEVIDMYLPDVQKEAAAQARSNLLPEIMDGLYGYTNKKGEYVAPTPESYRNANEKLMLLKQYDPETANPLLSGSITPRDIYNQNRADTVYGKTRQDLLTDRAEARSNKKQDVQDSIALKRDAEKQQFLDDVKLVMDIYGVGYQDAAQYVLGGRGRGGGGRTNAAEKSPLESAEYKEAKKIVEELNPEVLGRDLTAAEVTLQKQASAVLQAAREAAFGYGGNSSGDGRISDEIDWNNYDHDIRVVDGAREKGYSDKDISAILLRNMGAGDLYNNVVKDKNLPNMANTQQNDTDAAIAAIAAQKGIFADQDNERSGLVKALSDGLTVKQYLDNKYRNK